jgi:hypothetical protein
MARSFLRSCARRTVRLLRELADDAGRPGPSLVDVLRGHGASVGRDVFFGPEVFIEVGFARFFVAEDGAVVGPRAAIILHDSALSNVLGLPVRFSRVTLKKNSYIGACSLILPGVTIGEQAIVGAGSVVTRDVAPGTVAYGVPARAACSIADLEGRFSCRMAGGRDFYLAFGAWRDLPEPRDEHVARLYRQRVQEYFARSDR